MKTGSMGLVLATALLVLGTIEGAAQGSATRVAAPAGAYVYFHYPLNNTTVPSKFKVRIGLRNMGVAPAGINRPGTGHHHLLIDTQLASPERPIPNDHQHIHLGNGQTEVDVTLAPGRHTLQLVVGDHDHVPHMAPVVSQRITIQVKDDVAASVQ